MGPPVTVPFLFSWIGEVRVPKPGKSGHLAQPISQFVEMSPPRDCDSHPGPHGTMVDSDLNKLPVFPVHHDKAVLPTAPNDRMV